MNITSFNQNQKVGFSALHINNAVIEGTSFPQQKRIFQILTLFEKRCNKKNTKLDVFVKFDKHEEKLDINTEMSSPRIHKFRAKQPIRNLMRKFFSEPTMQRVRSNSTLSIKLDENDLVILSKLNQSISNAKWNRRGQFMQKYGARATRKLAALMRLNN